MFEWVIYSEDTLRTNAALYGCSLCPPPPPDECPDEDLQLPYDS
jgi:hypothetical protein